MENVFPIGVGSNLDAAITGEVIYESIHHNLNKKSIKAAVHKAVERRVREISGSILWASYLVIFSPGQEYDEVRCQIDIETNGDCAGFAIGFGLRPNHAFNDAIERMQWYEKNQPMQISI